MWLGSCVEGCDATLQANLEHGASDKKVLNDDSIVHCSMDVQKRLHEAHLQVVFSSHCISYAHVVTINKGLIKMPGSKAVKRDVTTRRNLCQSCCPVRTYSPRLDVGP